MSETVWIILSGKGLFVTLAVLAWIDARTFRLPNLLTIPLIFAGLTFNFYFSTDLLPFLIGALVGYAVFWIIETGYRLIRKKEGLGRGDAKLLAAGGAWCGWMALPFIILLASGAALGWLVLTRQTQRTDLKFPFGPFLAVGIGVVWVAIQAMGYPG